MSSEEELATGALIPRIPSRGEGVPLQESCHSWDLAVGRSAVALADRRPAGPIRCYFRLLSG